MKKLFLSFAVIAGMSMISCGNKAADNAEAEAVDTTEVAAGEEITDTIVNGDTVAADTTVAVVAE